MGQSVRTIPPKTPSFDIFFSVKSPRPFSKESPIKAATIKMRVIDVLSSCFFILFS